MPVLVEASTRDSADVNFFAINLQEAPGPVSQYAADYGATFPI
jgi:hypothetical protein